MGSARAPGYVWVTRLARVKVELGFKLAVIFTTSVYSGWVWNRIRNRIPTLYYRATLTLTLTLIPTQIPALELHGQGSSLGLGLGLMLRLDPT